MITAILTVMVMAAWGQQPAGPEAGVDSDRDLAYSSDLLESLTCWDCGDACYDCSKTHVECGLPPRACGTGAVREVVDGCWGACVRPDACAPPICTSDADCQSGTYCRKGSGMPGDLGVCVWWVRVCNSTPPPGCWDARCSWPFVVNFFFAELCLYECVPEWQCEPAPDCTFDRPFQGSAQELW